MNKPKILFAGDSLLRISGLSYVALNFALRFCRRKYKVFYAVISGGDSNNDCLKKFGKEFGETLKDMPIYNTQLLDPNKFEKFDDVVKKIKPNVVISVHDPWNLDQIAYSRYKDSFFWIAYLTIEVEEYPLNVIYPTAILPNLRKSIRNILLKSNMLIPVTEMGKRALEKWQLQPTENIFNGVDWDKRCKEKIEKSSILGSIALMKNYFIFMTLGQNTERKRIDLVVEAFYKFLQKVENKERYKLYLHCNINERCGGTDLNTMFSSLKLKDNIIVPQTLIENKTMSKEELYRIYSMCDCYIGLPAGEGFGYGFSEGMMHGKPIIYSDYGGHTSYLKDIGLPVKIKSYIYARNAAMKWGIADTDHAAEQMLRIVNDEELRKSLGEKGFKFARNNFKWDDIFLKFEYYLTEGYKKFDSKNILGKFNLRRLA